MMHATERTGAHHPFENIPDELTGRPQWIVWRLEDRGRPKPDKVPYHARTGAHAKPNDPATWGTYAAAVRAYHGGGYDGIGYVFAESDPYVGVDLDGCRDPDTGALESREAQIINELQSYTELSPSETGAHVIVRGHLPPRGRKKGNIEMYSQGRFFTITGKHLDGTPTTIEERQDELTQLHARIFGPQQRTRRANSTGTGHSPELRDGEVLARAMRAKNGEKFTTLWRGNTAGYSSHSEADLALCNLLAFHCGPRPEQIDRLYRQSQLYREKWDEKHSSDGRTYGEMTIEKALAGVRFARDGGDNTRTVQQGPEPGPEPEPEPEPESPEEHAARYPCPAALWRGVFARVASALGKQSWEVWLGTYAALSALAQRLLDWFYYADPILGMSYSLLLNPTGAGKNLVVNTVQDLLPADYPTFYSVQSGPGLIPLLTDDPLDNKTGRLVVHGRPTLLVSEEWSRLLQVGGIEHSTLVEDLNTLFQRCRPWSQSRSHKLTSGGSITIMNPTLTICGTSTIKQFTSNLSERLIYSGYLNRYLILPGDSRWEEFTGQEYRTSSLRGLLDGLGTHAWGHGQNLRQAYADGAWERWLDLQRHFFLPLANNPETSEVMKRLHFYFHHVALIYAWSEKSPAIAGEHVHAAEQVITTSHQFLLALLHRQHAAVEPLRSQRRAMSIEQRIVAKVKREPGVSVRKIAQDLNRTASSEELRRGVENLTRAGVLRAHTGPRRQVRLYPIREDR